MAGDREHVPARDVGPRFVDGAAEWLATASMARRWPSARGSSTTAAEWLTPVSTARRGTSAGGSSTTRRLAGAREHGPVLVVGRRFVDDAAVGWRP
ncbi:MAG: hypothetical protein M9894_29410 [Planctomycetes bacterium]|nr:hypothetical protein [Planctomycetota bacterium]